MLRMTTRSLIWAVFGGFLVLSGISNMLELDHVESAVAVGGTGAVREPQAQQQQPTQPNAKSCTGTSVGFTPLTQLGTQQYLGMTGGLYPGGFNTRPSNHEVAGLAFAQQIKPLAKDGSLDIAKGKVVFLSIGMSNTSQESDTFLQLVRKDKDINPQLVAVNGAQGGMDTTRVIDAIGSGTGQQYWNTVRQRLAASGVTNGQVQVVWLKEAVITPTLQFPADALSLKDQLHTIVQQIKKEFPNVKIVYLSSRTYAGYASTKLNPEPFAYQSGFAVKWLIAEQIEGSAALNYDPLHGEVKAPWLAWGPYLWTDGLVPRKDGLVWECSDTAADGTHPSSSGQTKVAQLLLDFLKLDSTAVPWFVKRI